jgi:PAS domain S-box-containing protein
MPEKPVRTRQQLLAENADLKARLAEAEEALRPFRSGQQVFALTGADRPYRLLIEDMQQGALILRRDGVISYANPRFAEMLKTSLEKVIGSAIAAWLAPDSHELLQTLLQTGGAEKRGEELTLTAADDAPVSVYLSMTQLSADEWSDSVCVVVTDLTERMRVEEEIRKLNFELEQRVIERTMELETVNEALHDDVRQRQRVEEMLRRSELRYRTLFESAGDAIFIVDLTGHIIEANHMAGQQLGYSHAELQGLPLSTFDASPEVASVDERIHRLRQQGEQVFEAVHRRRDGSELSVEIKSSIVEYGGSPAILGVMRDITERKRAGQALQRYANEQAALYNTALLLSAQLDVSVLLRLIVEQVTGLLGVTAGGVYRYDDQRTTLSLAVGLDFFADYLGVEIKPGEGLSGRAFQQRKVLRLDDYRIWDGQAPAYRHETRIHSIIAAPLLGKHAPLGVLVVADQHTQRFDDHDAQLVELLAAEAAVALENAQLYEQQQAHYRRLRDAQTRLIQSEKMSALGRLIASISHEINNPLQAVQGCLTLVREGIEETPDLDQTAAASWLQDLEVAASEVQRIANIVQRLRDFYRPARTGWHTVDVLSTIDTVLALSARQLQHSRITLEQVRPAAPSLLITTNADQLKQIILNLVLNAIDAMPGGGRLRVTTALESTTGPARVRIDFADSGQGIAPEDLTRIFEPFFTTKETGSGLGLSISYELIKALGGDISVTSEIGAGSTFALHLPVDAPDKQEVTA